MDPLFLSVGLFVLLILGIAVCLVFIWVKKPEVLDRLLEIEESLEPDERREK